MIDVSYDVVRYAMSTYMTTSLYIYSHHTARACTAGDFVRFRHAIINASQAIISLMLYSGHAHNAICIIMRHMRGAEYYYICSSRTTCTYTCSYTHHAYKNSYMAPLSLSI